MKMVAKPFINLIAGLCIGFLFEQFDEEWIQRVRLDKISFIAIFWFLTIFEFLFKLSMTFAAVLSCFLASSVASAVLGWNCPVGVVWS